MEIYAAIKELGDRIDGKAQQDNQQEIRTNQSTSLSKQELMNDDTQVLETGYEPREPQREIHKAVKDNSWTVCSRTPKDGQNSVCNQSAHTLST